ncbi:hypothetical protein L226DRAFT_576598 [Lentinus tigrinus ALCF2SS1-7]|uniref:uncharacterized protein n=1 Tax=Lentinus tigrinus ALCF2SS1-7 TaxID=1328758 RepID=UPI0011661276|nr:hypothetical protein L226DRAFT_576598 [Lentinus tigrinus ALCF2SS1-7]
MTSFRRPNDRAQGILLFTRYELTETIGPICEAESTAALHDPATHALELAHALAFRNNLDNSILATPGRHVTAQDVKAFVQSVFGAVSVDLDIAQAVRPESPAPDTSYPAGQSIRSLLIPVPTNTKSSLLFQKVTLLPVLGFINPSLSVSVSPSLSFSLLPLFSVSFLVSFLCFPTMAVDHNQPRAVNISNSRFI